MSPSFNTRGGNGAQGSALKIGQTGKLYQRRELPEIGDLAVRNAGGNGSNNGGSSGRRGGHSGEYRGAEKKTRRNESRH